MDPAHMTELSAVRSTGKDCGTEDGFLDVEPPADGSSQWMRWMLSQQQDFAEEKNMLTNLVHSSGNQILFLPKFHCELNWAELYWCVLKSCAREKIDGTWSTMVKAVWQACGENNISPDLSRRFARKVREMISLYAHGTTGPFAIWCQKKMNGHRVSFFNATALQQWKVGSVATCTVTDYGVKQLSEYRCYGLTTQ